MMVDSDNTQTDFVGHADGTAIDIRKTIDLAELKGCLTRPIQAMSLADMDRAIIESAASGFRADPIQ